MKPTGFLVLCLAVTALATPLSARSRPRRQSEECENMPEGLPGILQQLGNLVGNLLDNVGRVQLSGLLTGNQDAIRTVTNLLRQISQILKDLLGSNMTDSDANERHGLLVTLIQNIKDLLNDFLGDNSGTTWACNSSNGLIGSLINNTIGSLGNLTGSFANDQGPLAGLLRIIFQAVGSVAALLTPM